MVNTEEASYLNLLERVLSKKDYRPDRTGTGVKSIFGTQLRYSLEGNAFPLFTTRKMFFRGIVEETLLFLRGDCDTTKLVEKGISIWKGNSSREFLDKRGLKHLPEGNLGKGYPFQYRNFGGGESSVDYLESSKRTGVDQIKMVIDTLKTNPYDRRMLVSAWNPKQNEESALPACHSFWQVFVDDGKLSLQAYLRSSDLILGYSWNTAYYALICHIFAKACGFSPGEVLMTTGDTHIYSNLEEVAREQLKRIPYPFSKLEITKDISSLQDIEGLKYEDFKLTDYVSHPKLTGSMAI